MPHLAAAILAVAFVVGVVGNQVIDTAVDDEMVSDVKRYQDLYKCWHQQHPNDHVAPTLKTAEFDVATRYEFARAYLRRHGAIVRIIRAAAVGLALLLASMAIYEIQRFRRRSMIKRYTSMHFLFALLLLGLCVIAYTSEVSQISKRVLELATLQTPQKLYKSCICDGHNEGRL
jgi:hypothetical protein